MWTADQALQRVKEALSSPLVLASIDPAIPTVLQTFISRLYGGGHFRLIQCGSRFLTDTEVCYATIELELLTVVRAMMKCKFYPTGLQCFGLVTDHRPLVPILNSHSLDAIDNPRPPSLEEKISAFIFTAAWRPGKELCIPYALFRSPVSNPTGEDDVLDAETSFSFRSITLQAVEFLATDVDYGASGQSSEVAMDEFRRAASENPAYFELLQCVRLGFQRDRYSLPIIPLSSKTSRNTAKPK